VPFSLEFKKRFINIVDRFQACIFSCEEIIEIKINKNKG